MIEIVFSSAACDSLRGAMICSTSTLLSSAKFSIKLHAVSEEEAEKHQREFEERKRLLELNAKPYEPKHTNVFGLEFVLSIGDISEDKPGILRQQVLESLRRITDRETGWELAQRQLQKANSNLEAVISRAIKGEDIRIWYSSQPDELCGLYWLMSKLSKLEGQIGETFTVQLPDLEVNEKGQIIQNYGWGNMYNEKWNEYIPIKRAMPMSLRSCYAARWEQLQTENAPLRAMINGRLVSVAESFYDEFIIKEIVAEEPIFKEGEFISRFLLKYQLGIGDLWIAARIEEMIKAGKLEPVTAPSENSPTYWRKLRKCF